MKRILPLILAAAMTLTAGTAALADNVSDALEKAATMTNDELYAKAQEEMAAGAQLNFYSTTSFAEKAAANFMRAYPALDGKVVYAEIDDGESYTILTNTVGSGVKDSGGRGPRASAVSRGTASANCGSSSVVATQSRCGFSSSSKSTSAAANSLPHWYSAVFRCSVKLTE